MNLNRIITPSPDIISQEIGGETVLLDLKNENYFGLDGVGSRIWQLIEKNGDLQNIYQTLLEEYEVDAEQLQEDLEVLIGNISERGLVTLHKKL